jgi:transposase
VLEDAVEVWLLNARHVPPAPIRELRNLTRYRKAQIEEHTRESQRLDEIPQDAG